MMVLLASSLPLEEFVKVTLFVVSSLLFVLNFSQDLCTKEKVERNIQGIKVSRKAPAIYHLM